VPLAQRGERPGVAVLRACDQDRIAQPLVLDRRPRPERLLDSTPAAQGRLHRAA
jgi:hypothetical protein